MFGSPTEPGIMPLSIYEMFDIIVEVSLAFIQDDESKEILGATQVDLPESP